MRLFKPSGAVGLELDNGSIRVMELKGTVHKPVPFAAGQIEIPGGAVLEGAVKDVQLVAEAIKELWAKSGIDQREVVMGITNKGLLMRLAKLPKIPEDKLFKALRFQVDEYFPIPLDELIFDYAVVGETTGDNGPQLEILLVAIRKELLHNSLEALSAASLIPEIIDASPLALLRTMPRDQHVLNMILADISNDLTTLLLVIEGAPRFARVVPNTLASYTGGPLIPPGDVTEQQVAVTLEEGNRQNGFDEWFAGISGDIVSTSTYYMAQNQAPPVDKIILSGRGSCVQGLVEYLQEDLGLPVEVINPLAKLHAPVQAGKINWEQSGSEFAVATGLALRGLK
ncbi:type IV pilus biogenesis protein PilM [Desulfoscipio gibsoniae]|uniref:Type IV pilus assembly protein PilM n=1 Tax=Desulfoscipio gibsoniae DSM 7213 TaxID=767817 RepID=R4KNF2_9FIRM|nr:type IV pilus assembly protein PilM [Desulfoscipio gibsoniae]AGL02060.1 type IV pilus assembly protein PilM [Desulfoscipio gibsoniae DSM 7213]